MKAGEVSLEFGRSTVSKVTRRTDSKHLRDSNQLTNSLLVQADVHFVNSPVLNPGHRRRCSTSYCAKFHAARTKRRLIFRRNNMATGGEESELKSSTPTRSSGKRKASAVREWRYQKRRRKCERERKKLKMDFAKSSEMFPHLAFFGGM